ncbi:MAG: hypothetical protein LBE75_02205 [Burkholderiales bacterium]|jgi:hypothetical protein|nr:hypothetical protein [Burkholderiales bacterium]
MIAFETAASGRGLIIGNVNTDGRIHRVPVEGKPKTDKTGWYVFHADGSRSCAAYGRWDDGLPPDTWRESGNVAWTPAEKTRIRQAMRDVNYGLKVHHCFGAKVHHFVAFMFFSVLIGF